ncbi:hypothetical protein [Parasitella parasitica]|uniref:Arf-GAP domain-containing protein n=1 Tax=Parasitella parasitica TaxID=35722 RepID=A0A0B7MYW2_9FUNG|nr:hypothetical protein [Parasitella parasitica]
MSLFLAKKQEDNNQKKVRDLLKLKENKKCFDCPTKSPTFVNSTIQTFICARCSGLVREVGHRVKAVSASKFSGPELMALKKGGNGIALKIWLSNYSTHDALEAESDADVRAFMKQKYYEFKWLDRALLQSHTEQVRALIAKSFTEDGLPIVTKSRTRIVPGFARVPLIGSIGGSASVMNTMPGDDDDDYIEFSAIEDENGPYVVPERSVSRQTLAQQPATTMAPFPMPPTSPICRSSMESNNSYSSSSQEDVSVYNYRGSQEMIRDDFYTSNAATSQPASASATQVLTKEQIAERCRSSIASNKILVDSYPQQNVEPLPTTSITKKPLPTLTVDVNNNNTSGLISAKQPSYSPSHTPTLVATRQQHANHVASASASLRVTPSASNPIIKPSRPPTTATAAASTSVFDSILSDLAGLKLEKTVRRATYTGGVLSPATVGASGPLEPSKSSPRAETSQAASPSSSSSMFSGDFFAQLNKSNAAAETKSPRNDPYAALRGIPTPAAAVASTSGLKDEDKNAFSSEEDDDEEDPWQVSRNVDIQTP